MKIMGFSWLKNKFTFFMLDQKAILIDFVDLVLAVNTS